MYLYLVTDPEGGGYDEFDSFVVATTSPEKAKLYNPKGKLYPCQDWSYNGAWSKSPNKIEATLIGVAAPSILEGEIVISSFNAA